MKTHSVARLLIVGAGLAAAATAAQAKVYPCTAADGKTIFQDTPCKRDVVPQPAAPPPACVLEPGRRRQALVQEDRFLGRFPDETAHRRAELADLQTFALRLRTLEARLAELQGQLQPILTELEFYMGKTVPAWLLAKAAAITAQFHAVADLFRNLGAEVDAVDARYQCERDTFGKMWRGGSPGDSACQRPACAPS